MTDTIEFHALNDEPAPTGEPVLVRGNGAEGFVYAIAKYEPNPVHDGWTEFVFRQRGDGSEVLLWFRPTAWAQLNNE